MLCLFVVKPTSIKGCAFQAEDHGNSRQIAARERCEGLVEYKNIGGLTHVLDATCY